jgi:hypothetical protein
LKYINAESLFWPIDRFPVVYDTNLTSTGLSRSLLKRALSLRDRGNICRSGAESPYYVFFRDKPRY